MEKSLNSLPGGLFDGIDKGGQSANNDLPADRSPHEKLVDEQPKPAIGRQCAYTDDPWPHADVRGSSSGSIYDIICDDN